MVCTYTERKTKHEGRPYRTLYAFDPRRYAILLIGGDKTGNARWYEIYVPKADLLYDEHLEQLRKEGKAHVMIGGMVNRVENAARGGIGAAGAKPVNATSKEKQGDKMAGTISQETRDLAPGNKLSNDRNAL